MMNTKLKYIQRPKITWCSFRWEIVPFKQLIQEHYRELAISSILQN